MPHDPSLRERPPALNAPRRTVEQASGQGRPPTAWTSPCVRDTGSGRYMGDGCELRHVTEILGLRAVQPEEDFACGATGRRVHKNS